MVEAFAFQRNSAEAASEQLSDFAIRNTLHINADDATPSMFATHHASSDCHPDNLPLRAPFIAAHQRPPRKLWLRSVALAAHQNLPRAISATTHRLR